MQIPVVRNVLEANEKPGKKLLARSFVIESGAF